ncbi:hypothetical protein C8J56DRAFT_587028 [Mycena floridula]|nr:hypothetical protein C8J56DRAFT_587028 [Mycena floridula]
MNLSALNHLVAMNGTPSEQESQQLREFLVKQAAEAASIAAEIARLQRLLDEKTELEATYRPLLSSFRRFPAELLSEIFFQCRAAEPKKSAIPVLLSSISKKWRSIALSTPVLWNRFFWTAVDFDVSALNASQELRLETVKLFKLFISRSGTIPLHISLDLRDQSGPVAQELLDVCMQEIGRWKEISLVPAALTLLPLAPGTILPLEVAFFESETESHIPWASSIVRAAADSLVDLGWELRSTWSPVCLEKLTLLQLDTDLPGITESLRQCPMLEGCAIWMRVFIEETGPAQHIVHDHLLSVSLYPPIGLDTALELVMDALTLPALQAMTIDGRDEPFEGEITILPDIALSALLSRSRCPLKRLVINNVLVDDGFSECLKPGMLPNLETLRITFEEQFRTSSDSTTDPFFIPDSVLEALTWDADARSLPKLSNLALMIGFNQVSTLESMLVSRLTPGENTLTVFLQTIVNPQQESYISSAVDNIRSQGVDIELETFADTEEDSASRMKSNE